MSEDRTQRLRQRVDALSDAQRHALADALVREGRVHAPQRLVGFLVSGGDSLPPDEAMRAFLAERLPEYMIPSRFVALERLPRSSAGKLDRRALARLDGVALSTAPARRGAVAPRTAIEARLAAIWKEVLKVDDVGIDDDFFEIGGDSLLSIRVIARAGREGIRVSPERFFERPTIAHMAAGIAAAAAGAPAAGGRAVEVDAVGEAPLTPIQHWFLDAIPRHRDRWNQSYLLELGHPLEAARLGEVVRLLVRQHDALRLRLACRDGAWRQDFAAPGEPPFRVVTLDGVAPERYGEVVADECDREHAALRIEEGALFRCVVFVGAGGWRRLLLLGHHLVLDGVSWSVILEDLSALVAQAIAGEPLRLPGRTAPARAWAIALADRAAKAEAAWADHWLSMPVDAATLLVDLPDEAATVAAAGVPGCNRDAAVHTLTLDAEESRQLLQEAPRRLELSVQALLLAALLLTWRRWTGGDALRLDLEGHGRDVLGDALDVSRTVGWFTTVFPVRLAMPAGASDGGEPSPQAVASEVQRTLDALPLRGAAHGLIRYLAPDERVRAALAAQGRPALLFNHLGTHDLALPPASCLRVTDEPQGRARSMDAARPYLLELNSRVEQGVLVMTIEHSRRVHRTETVARFATWLREALSTVARAQPVRFGLAGLDPAVMSTVAGLLSELDED